MTKGKTRVAPVRFEEPPSRYSSRYSSTGDPQIAEIAQMCHDNPGKYLLIWEGDHHLKAPGTFWGDHWLRSYRREKVGLETVFRTYVAWRGND